MRRRGLGALRFCVLSRYELKIYKTGLQAIEKPTGAAFVLNRRAGQPAPSMCASNPNQDSGSRAQVYLHSQSIRPLLWITRN